MIGLTALTVGSFHSQPAAAQMNRGNFREVARELGLSQSQMRQVGGIMRDLNSDLEDILTDEQFDLLKESREQEQTQNPEELQEALDLTDDQSVEIAEARRETVSELQSVLTAEQIEGIMEMTGMGRF